MESNCTASEVVLRSLRSEDLPILTGWLNEPHVAKWWDGPLELADVVRKYSPRLDEDSPARVYIVEYSNDPVGLAQCYRHDSFPEWGADVGVPDAAGIDYLIGVSHLTGKGIGSAAIRAVSKIAFELYPGIISVVSVPQKDNVASWRALEKAGFSRIAERKLSSEHPSDSGISYIYEISRHQLGSGSG